MTKQRRTASRSSRKAAASELRPEYDFSDGVRGKYAKRFEKGTNLALLDPDVAEVFTDSVAVNRALRALREVTPARRTARPRRRTA
jgi:hypothetical protein